MTEPYIQFYPADYLADTMHLTLEQHGAYMKLLFCMWRAGGWLDDDDKKCCMILGVGNKKWQSLKSTLSTFFLYENGKFSQKRLLAERKKVEELREKKSFAGTQSAKAKQQKNNNTTSTGVDDVLPLCFNNTRRNSEPEPDIDLVEVTKSIIKKPSSEGKKNYAGDVQDVTAPAHTKNEKIKRRVRLAPDFKPPESWLDYATSKYFGLPEAKAMWEKFRNYHLSKGSVMLDWDAAWRTWVLNEQVFEENRRKRQ